MTDSEGKGSSLHFFHQDHLVRLADATIPAQTVLIPTEKRFEITQIVQDDLEQSWSFPEAREVVASE